MVQNHKGHGKVGQLREGAYVVEKQVDVVAAACEVGEHGEEGVDIAVAA